MRAIGRFGRVAAVALPVVLADQATKAIARATLAHGEVVEVLPFANLRLGFNRGISFDLTPADSAFGVLALVGLTGAICLALGVWASRPRTSASAWRHP
jgi:lipoprotein signal peptidase